MSYRKLTMTDVSEIIRRWQSRQSARQIARETGLDRKTVRRYLAAAAACDLVRDREASSQELDRIAQRVQARPKPERSETWKRLLPHKEQIAASVIGQKPLRLGGIHKRLLGEGVSVTYWMLRRFAIEMQRELAAGQTAHTSTQPSAPQSHESADTATAAE